MQKYLNICPVYRILSFYFIGFVDNAMFPARMRKSHRSLSLLAEAKVIDWLLRLIDKSPSNFWRNVVKNRIYLRKNLPAHLRSILLEKVWQTLCFISLRNLYFLILSFNLCYGSHPLFYHFQLIPYYDEVSGVNDIATVVDVIKCKHVIKWKYPCLSSQARNSCMMHEQCKIVWKRCDRILELVFAFDTNRLGLNFRKVSIDKM